MELISVISPPIVGGLIGYITNYLAIKMLFRPLKPVMIGPFRIPFTPGIVPKRKDALAAVLGNAIVAKFFNADDLVLVFTSDYFTNAVADGILALICSRELSLSTLKKMQPDMAERSAQVLSLRIRDTILDSEVPELIVKEGERAIQKRFEDSVIGRAVARSAVYSLTEPLTEEIRCYLKKDGLSIIIPIVEEFQSDLMREPVGKLAESLLPDIDVLRRMVNEGYAGFMRANVRHIAESIDVGGMIRQKVIEMDPVEIEDLVVTVVNRELKFVIWFGALLGMLIGMVNIFL